jgi:putative ABC transport system substrate-binding protein
MMRRRAFLGVLSGSAAWPLLAFAQQRSTPVIGILGFGMSIRGAPGVAAFLQGLRELGYAEGRNVVIEYRWAEGRPERFPDLAAELVAQKVDVIFAAAGTLATFAAMRATSSIPIVFGVVGNPVEEGIVNNLARPNGNATGLSYVFDDLLGKWLELAMQVAPGASLVAVLSKTDATSREAWEGRQKLLTTLGQTLGVQVQVVAAQGPAHFDRAFSEISAKGAGALIVLQTPAFDAERQRIVDLAADRRLPTVYGDRNYVDSGGLLSYGPNLPDLHRRAATYVDKILKGAKPADLPVEQPTKFELVINLKTARTLGLAVPPSLLATASEVIE